MINAFVCIFYVCVPRVCDRRGHGCHRGRSKSTLAANGAISRQGFLYNIMAHTPANIQLFSRRLHGASDDLDEGGSVCYHFFATFDRLTQCPVRLNRNKRDTSMNARSTELATASILLIVPRSRTRAPNSAPCGLRSDATKIPELESRIFPYVIRIFISKHGVSLLNGFQ